MKKFTLVALVMLTLGLTGCNNNQASNSNDNKVTLTTCFMKLDYQNDKFVEPIYPYMINYVFENGHKITRKEIEDIKDTTLSTTPIELYNSSGSINGYLSYFGLYYDIERTRSFDFGIELIEDTTVYYSIIG